jgi:hypothetical protein
MSKIDDLTGLLTLRGQLCDDCLAPAVGWKTRQQARAASLRLESAGLVSRRLGVCASCGGTKTVTRQCDVRTTGASPAGNSSPEPPMTPVLQKDRPWYWEGHVQATIVSHLVGAGWRITQAMSTASKAPGIDVVATRDGHELWVTVKGYPQATARTAAPTQARHWFAEAMLDVVRYRTKRPDAGLAVGLPAGFACYLNLAQSVEWLHRSAPFTFYWVGEDEAVREQ